MSKELIERLREASAFPVGRTAMAYGEDIKQAADALESLGSAYSGAVEAGKALAQQAFKAEQERDALAAELKALREQEPTCWTTYPPSGRYSKCKAEVDLWGRNNWTVVPLYADPIPARELTASDLHEIRMASEFVASYQPPVTISAKFHAEKLKEIADRLQKGEGRV